MLRSLKLLSLGLVFGLFSLVVRGQELTEEKFLLTFIPNIQFSPVYVAIESGYFAEAGMSVTVEYLNEPDVVDLVATMQNHYGIVSGEQVILAGLQGRPIQYVYNWFQKYPIGIVYDANAGIETVADLKGKTVGIPGRFGSSYTGLTTILNANGMTEADIDLQEIGFNAPETFCLGQVDASVVYINNEPLQIQNRADAGECGAVKEVGVFSVSDYVTLVSNGIITNNDWMATQPEQVRAFINAYHHGLKTTIQNPARAYLLSVAHVENLPLSDELKARLDVLATEQDTFLATNPEFEAIAESRVALRETLHSEFDADILLQFDVLLNTIELWDTEALGMSSTEAWDNMRDVLASLNIVSADVDVSAFYRNEFVPTTVDK